MDILQVSKILNKIGISTVSDIDYLEEKKNGPHENYYKFQKKTEDTWVYGIFMVEKQNKPHLEVIKEFNTESEGVKYYFLKRLASYYFSEKVSTFKMEHSELDIGGITFNEEKFFKAMHMLGIPLYLIKIGRVSAGNRAINISKVDDTNSVVSFVNSEGDLVHSSLPLSHHRALSFAFRKVYLLYIYEQEVSNILEEEGIVLSDDDINIFLT